MSNKYLASEQAAYLMGLGKDKWPSRVNDQAKKWLSRGGTYDFEFDEYPNDTDVSIKRTNLSNNKPEDFIYNSADNSLFLRKNGGLDRIDLNNPDFK